MCRIIASLLLGMILYADYSGTMIPETMPNPLENTGSCEEDSNPASAALKKILDRGGNFEKVFGEISQMIICLNHHGPIVEAIIYSLDHGLYRGHNEDTDYEIALLIDTWWDRGTYRRNGETSIEKWMGRQNESCGVVNEIYRLVYRDGLLSFLKEFFIANPMQFISTVVHLAGSPP